MIDATASANGFDPQESRDWLKNGLHVVASTGISRRRQCTPHHRLALRVLCPGPVDLPLRRQKRLERTPPDLLQAKRCALGLARHLTSVTAGVVQLTA
ncbi:MAG: hypothetical protein COB65_04010 [Thalassobium sp.]|nr:MAG: hypothetical protein COB65_04010 [Thalassobium sp.]